jgi:acyl-CoA thioester hydrolase
VKRKRFAARRIAPRVGDRFRINLATPTAARKGKPPAMARVKLKLPDTFGFTTDIRLRISDINYGNHLGNDAVLSLVHEARLRFLQQFGLSELNIGGFGLILADAAIVFKSQGFYGDVVSIAVAVDEVHRCGCDFFYRILHRDTGREIARAKTGVVFFDYGRQRLVNMPEVFRAALQAGGLLCECPIPRGPVGRTDDMNST